MTNISELGKRVHQLKTWTSYFAGLAQFTKSAEVRDMTDREFREGDYLYLQEYVLSGDSGYYTGKYEVRRISRVDDLRPFMKAKYPVLLSFHGAQVQQQTQQDLEGMARHANKLSEHYRAQLTTKDQEIERLKGEVEKGYLTGIEHGAGRVQGECEILQSEVERLKNIIEFAHKEIGAYLDSYSTMEEINESRWAVPAHTRLGMGLGIIKPKEAPCSSAS